MNKLESSDDFENCFGPKNRGVPSESGTEIINEF